MSRFFLFLYEITWTTRGVLNLAAGLLTGGSGCFYIAVMAHSREMSNATVVFSFLLLVIFHGVLSFLLTRYFSGAMPSTAPFAFAIGFVLPMILLILLFCSSPMKAHVSRLIAIGAVLAVVTVSSVNTFQESQRRRRPKRHGFEIRPEAGNTARKRGARKRG